MRRLSWVLALAVVFSACKKEGAEMPQAGEGAGSAEAHPAAEQEGVEAPGPYTIRPEKLDAYVGYQRQMVKVYASVQKDMQALDARILQDGSSEAAKARLKVIEAKAQAEEAARREAGLTADDVNGIAEVVTAVIAQRQLARQMGFDEELQRLEALQARLTPEQQKDLASQVAEMRQKAQDFEGLADLRRTYGEENVTLVLAREPELTQSYQEMLQAFGGGAGVKR